MRQICVLHELTAKELELIRDISNVHALLELNSSMAIKIPVDN